MLCHTATLTIQRQFPELHGALPPSHTCSGEYEQDSAYISCVRSDFTGTLRVVEGLGKLTDSPSPSAYRYGAAYTSESGNQDASEERCELVVDLEPELRAAQLNDNRHSEQPQDIAVLSGYCEARNSWERGAHAPFRSW